jgi:hypothetical protein
MLTVLPVIWFCIFVFVFMSAQSVGLGLPEKITLAISVVGGIILSVGMIYYGDPHGGEVFDPDRRWWLSFAGVGIWILYVGGIPLTLLCIRRTWLQRRRIFPFFYGQPSGQPQRPAESSSDDGSSEGR